MTDQEQTTCDAQITGHLSSWYRMAARQGDDSTCEAARARVGGGTRLAHSPGRVQEERRRAARGRDGRARRTGEEERRRSNCRLASSGSIR